MVSRTPPIRPSQLLTLKALDPLDQQPERGEDDDGQADEQKVEHGVLLGFGGLRRTPMALDDPSECPGTGNEPPLCGTHAGARRFLTRPMRQRFYFGAGPGEAVRGALQSDPSVGYRRSPPGA